jgi:hypothetical protein
MSESETTSTEADIEALKALQADASELERIENLLDRFNVFEAIGFGKQETMHSQFLAFLLDPAQNHGLGDLFLMRFLEKVSEFNDESAAPKVSVSAENGYLDQTRVETEIHTGDGRVDILLLNGAGRWAMVIENKIWTIEHSGQLKKYHRFVTESHPSWRVLGVYLTPFGALPASREDKEKYRSLSYSAVCAVVDEVLRSRDPSIRSDVRVSLVHYARMVRRSIVGDPEVINLCRDLYRKHKRAFDLVYEHRPEPSPSVRRLLSRLVNETDGMLLLGNYTNKYVYFHPEAWEVPALDTGKDRHGFFRFVFHNNFDQLVLYLETSLGDASTRQRLYEMGRKDEVLFNMLEDPDTEEYPKLYSRAFLTPEHYRKHTEDEREQEVRRQWGEYIDEDLPRIDEALREERWIWESVEENDST